MVILRYMHTISPPALVTTEYLYNVKKHRSMTLYHADTILCEDNFKEQHAYCMAIIASTQYVEHVLTQQCEPFTQSVSLKAPLHDAVYKIASTRECATFQPQTLHVHSNNLDEYTLLSLYYGAGALQKTIIVNPQQNSECTGAVDTITITVMPHDTCTEDIIDNLSQRIAIDLATCAHTYRSTVSLQHANLQSTRILKQDYIELLESYFENTLNLYSALPCHVVTSASYTLLMLNVLDQHISAYRRKQLLLHDAFNIHVFTIDTEYCIDFMQLRNKLIDDYVKIIHRSHKLFTYIQENKLSHYLCDINTCVTYIHTGFLSLWYSGLSLLMPITTLTKEDAKAQRTIQLAMSRVLALTLTLTDLLTHTAATLADHVYSLAYRVLDTQNIYLAPLLFAHINLIRLNIMHIISVKNIHTATQQKNTQTNTTDQIDTNAYRSWTQLLSIIDR